MTFSSTDILNQLDKALSLEQIAIEELALLRLHLDEADPIVDIKQDIQDLANFPERLNTSYKAEWISYCRKQLLKRCTNAKVDSPESLNLYIQHVKDEIKNTALLRQDILDHVRQIASMLEADNVKIIESEASKKIKNLIG